VGRRSSLRFDRDEWLGAGGGRSAIAIERYPPHAAIVARNAASLGVPGLRIVNGVAPEALDGLPFPDAIFAGGGIGDAGLLPILWARQGSSVGMRIMAVR